MKLRIRRTTLALAAILLLLVVLVLFTGGPKAEITANTAVIENGVQRIKVDVLDAGYSPQVVKLKLDTPVELTFAGKSYGCASAIVSRDFWQGVKMVKAGQDQIVSFTPTKTGSFTYSCTMGMYFGTIIVES